MALRSRIKENFTYDELKKINEIITDTSISDNNEKVDLIMYLIRNKGFLELGAGTNRFGALKDGYVFKFALDRYGKIDNNQEFEMSPKLQPYVTKTYENNGLVLVAEYANLISKEEFVMNKEVVRNVLEVLAEDYIFSDVGSVEKNFCNWAYNDEGRLVILDYGYFFERDDMIMNCIDCMVGLKFDSNYQHIVCPKCGRQFSAIELNKIQNMSDEEAAKTAIKGKITVNVNMNVFGKTLKEAKEKNIN